MTNEEVREQNIRRAIEVGINALMSTCRNRCQERINTMEVELNYMYADA